MSIKSSSSNSSTTGASRFRGNSQKRARRTTNQARSSVSFLTHARAPSPGATEGSWWPLPIINTTSTKWRNYRKQNLEQRAKRRIRETSIQEEFQKQALISNSFFSSFIISNETNRAWVAKAMASMAQSWMEHALSLVMRMEQSLMGLIKPYNLRASSSETMRSPWKMTMRPFARSVKRHRIRWPIN